MDRNGRVGMLCMYQPTGLAWYEAVTEEPYWSAKHDVASLSEEVARKLILTAKIELLERSDLDHRQPAPVTARTRRDRCEVNG